MTPKEKADELVHNMFMVGDVEEWDAIKCALIAVDEIIQSKPTSPLKGGYIELYSDMIDEATEFWEEVKNEISKL